MWKSQNNKKWVKKKERMLEYYIWETGFLLLFVCHMDLGLFVLLAQKASCTMLELRERGLSSLDPVSLVLPLGWIFSVSPVLFEYLLCHFPPVVYFRSLLYRCFIIQARALWPPSVCSLICYSLDSTESICFPLGWTESAQSMMPEIFRAIWLPQCPLLNAVFS